MQYNHNKTYRLVIANDTDAPEEVEFRIDIVLRMISALTCNKEAIL